MAWISEGRLGVVGAGTMGAGIAETAIRQGIATTLVEGNAEALAAAETRLVKSLAKSIDRGELDAAGRAGVLARLETTNDLGSLRGCDVVIEAISERFDAKRELFSQLAAICPPPTLLATNTSSLRVSALATAVPDPTRVVGMHFFNPVTRMRLVEVIPGADTEQAAVDRACRLGEALGKTVIVAADQIGFLVNRCARPFAGEALRLLAERVAEVEQIDRICRMGGGFAMGPFELVDLIGLDVNLEIAESFWTQSYGEPRWRPSTLQARLVDAGRLGRKSGSGFYAYGNGSHREPDPEPPAIGGGERRLVAIGGEGPVAEALRARAEAADFSVCAWGDPSAESAWLSVDAEPGGHLPLGDLGRAGKRARLCASSDLASSGDDRASGFHLIGPVSDDVRLVETTSLATTDPEATLRADSFFAALGFHREAVADAPGLVLGRIVSQLVNEAAFAIGEGIGSPADVDSATTLGLNYPRGPVAWSAGAGLVQVRSILAALHSSRGEERYRLAPRLQSGEALS